MANLFEKIFGKAVPKGDKPPRNWVKPVGIASGVLWVASLGAVYALKDIKLSPADTHDAAGHDEEAGPLHGVPAAAEDHGGKHAEVEGGKSDGHASEPHAAAHEAPHGKPAPKAAHAEEKHDKDHKAHAEAPAHTDSHGHGEEAPGNASHGHVAADPGDASPGDPAAAGAIDDAEAREALRELVDIHASRGDLDKAVKPLKKLLRIPTRDVALLSLATEIYLGTGHYQEALGAARKAIRHAAPGRVDLQVAAILARYRLGEVGEAFKEAEAAAKEHPKDLQVLTALGTMEVEMGPAHPTYGQALEKALKLKPDHIPALYQLGRKAQLEGNYKDAETIFRKVLKREPRHAKARGQLGTAFFQLGKHAEARKEFEAALALNPKDYNTWFNLGELHLAQAGRERAPGRIRAARTEAMTAFLKAVELNPEHAEAHYRAGVILNGNGQHKEAIRHLEAALEVDSHHVPTLVQLAVAFENLKLTDRAKACLEKALKLDPEDKIVLFKLKHLGNG